TRNAGTLGTRMVWACTVSLAATPAPSYFLRVREMFQFPGLPPHRLCVHRRVTASRSGGPPFRHPRLNACPRLPEAFRCYATSFIGTSDQGIHPTPCVTGSPARARVSPRRTPPVTSYSTTYLLRFSSIINVPRTAVPSCCLAMARQQPATVHR